jgi:C4-dicarboxylate transporter, DctQ subunit
MTESGQRASAGDRVLRAIDRFHARLENALNFVAAAFIFFLMFLGVAEVLSRRLMGIPIPGHIDIVTLIMATFALLGAAYCQRLGGHIRMEILVSRLRGRTMWIVEAFGIVVALFIIGVLIEGTWYHFLRSWQIGDSTLDIRLPTWPSKLLAPLALAVLWLRLWIQLWGYLRLIAAPDADHLAVPETKGVLDTAREEAEAALRGAAADVERAGRG